MVLQLCSAEGKSYCNLSLLLIIYVCIREATKVLLYGMVLSCWDVLSFGIVVVKALPLRSRACQQAVRGICWASRLRVAIFGRQTD